MGLLTTSFEPGDVVLALLPGAREAKRRPGVVLSSALYDRRRSDVIVGILTSQLHEARAPFDHLLRDWAEAGLKQPTLFRAFITTVPKPEVIRLLGRLSDRDWSAVRECVRKALAPLGDATE